ncbi:MFS transporter [Uliginosibacterium sp. 31-16]|uniref:MFS transporter n=1 Tax=Uliginosibacterium sp. 31-16 TaxID=3068315 RepID=UPI00273DDE65|nr:MFS transporter [Uliginosibacterium sp. 31-16]MDP5240823.1 MFS transporter [Uliginosibacterium sp. 31-16]
MTGTPHPNHWIRLALAAAAVLAVTLGTRLSLGLFVSPLNTATGLGIASISLAMAVNQFVWGAIQPVAGAVADRYGPGRVLVAALILQAVGLLLTPLMHSTPGLSLVLGVLMAAGTGSGAFSVLIGAIAQRLPPQHRGMSAGIINAGGSVGQFLFAPLVQGLILFSGWVGALCGLAFITLCALPLARILKRPASITSARMHAAEQGGERLSSVLRTALRDRSYLLLHAGFFTCGFHIAFLVTHLPGEVSLCVLPAGVASGSLAVIGLFNILGSLTAGWLVQHLRSKLILVWLYGARAAMVLLFLASPRTSASFYLFAAGLGATWLATVPPTAGVVSKLFGNRYLSTLFGLTLLSHQIGGFLGAWLGGLALARWNSLTPMWWADMGLAAFAALVNLPIREPEIGRVENISAQTALTTSKS